jgi:hypothetical protein
VFVSNRTRKFLFAGFVLRLMLEIDKLRFPGDAKIDSNNEMLYKSATQQKLNRYNEGGYKKKLHAVKRSFTWKCFNS